MNHKYLKTVVLVMATLAYTFCVCFLESCSSSDSTSDMENTPVSESVVRLDMFLADYSGLSQEMKEMGLDSFAAPLSVLMAMSGHGTLSDSVLEIYSSSAPVRVFSPDVAAKYPLQSGMMDTLSLTAARVDDMLDSSVPTRIYTIVTPYNQSVVTADSIVLVGLNHYLGENYPGYAGVVPTYLLPRKKDSYLPYALAEGMLAGARPFRTIRISDVLSRMLYDGTLTYAVVKSVPGGSVREALSWTQEQLDWADAHEADVWRTLIAKNLLFSTSEADAVRLLSPSPHTTLISSDSPGQLGRYIGYCIVESYVNRNPEVSVKFLLSPEFYSAENTLEKACYHPR